MDAPGIVLANIVSHVEGAEAWSTPGKPTAIVTVWLEEALLCGLEQLLS